jgi:hypothetical protein
MQASFVSANPVDNKSGKNDKVTTSGNVTVSGSEVTAARKAEQSGWILKAEQWELSRSGDYVLSLTTVKTIVNAWLKDKHKTIEIQYPGGEEGEFWVQELFDWLVALGVPSASMVTTPGSGAVDVIRFGLIK